MNIEINHPAHRHPLRPYSEWQKRWACDGRRLPGGCKRSLNSYGYYFDVKRYRCHICNFDLCDLCACTSHVWHPHSLFLKESEGLCNGKLGGCAQMTKFMYNCDICDYWLCENCMSFKDGAIHPSNFMQYVRGQSDIDWIKGVKKDPDVIWTHCVKQQGDWYCHDNTAIKDFDNCIIQINVASNRISNIKFFVQITNLSDGSRENIGIGFAPLYFNNGMVGGAPNSQSFGWSCRSLKNGDIIGADLMVNQKNLRFSQNEMWYHHSLIWGVHLIFDNLWFPTVSWNPRKNPDLHIKFIPSINENLPLPYFDVNIFNSDVWFLILGYLFNKDLSALCIVSHSCWKIMVKIIATNPKIDYDSLSQSTKLPFLLNRHGLSIHENIFKLTEFQIKQMMIIVRSILSDISSGNVTKVLTSITNQNVPRKAYPILLYHAVYSKNIEMVRSIIESTNVNVNETCQDANFYLCEYNNLLSIGSTPLHMAISKLDFEIFKYLMEKGANITRFNTRNVSPARMLAKRWYNKNNWVEIAEFLKKVIYFVGCDALKQKISRFIAYEISNLVMFDKIREDFPDFDVISVPFRSGNKTPFDKVLNWCDDIEVIKYFTRRNAPLSSNGRAVLKYKCPDIQLLLSSYDK